MPLNPHPYNAHTPNRNPKSQANNRLTNSDVERKQNIMESQKKSGPESPVDLRWSQGAKNPREEDRKKRRRPRQSNMDNRTQQTKEQQTTPDEDPAENQKEETEPGPAEPTEAEKATEKQKSSRQVWSREDYLEVMWCHYYVLETTGTTNIQRTFETWKKRNPNARRNLTANTLATQRRYIVNKKKLPQIELENIKDAVRIYIEAELEPPKTEEEKPDNANGNLDILNQNPDIEITSPNVTLNRQETMETYTPEEENEILELKNQIVQEMQHWTIETKRDQLPKIRDTQMTELLIKKINRAIDKIKAESETLININIINSLTYAAAIVACKKLNIKKPKERTTHENRARRRIQAAVAKLRKDLSQLVDIKKNSTNTLSNRMKFIKEKLHNKYKIDNQERETEVIETVKQKLQAKAQRLKRYEKRVLFYQQNKTFREKPKYFYRSLQKEKNEIEKAPELNSTYNFWKSIWSQKKSHNTDAKWIARERVRNQNVPDMEWQPITEQEVTTTLKKSANWKAAGMDGIQNYWLKQFTSTHSALADTYNNIIKGNETIPDWLTTGVTYLIPKSSETENPKNYRPITCLTTTYKAFTAIISERIYNHLEKNNLYPQEQKGCLKNSYGCKDQHLINKTIINNCKRKGRNLSTGWVDYRKAFDSVPHTWIIETLKLYKIHPNTILTIEKAMRKWNTTLTIPTTTSLTQVGNIEINCGIYQGDSLSPLLFCMALFPLSRELNSTNFGYQVNKTDNPISHLLYVDDLKLYGKNEKELNSLFQIVKTYSEDINMTFGLDKCAKLTILRGKITESQNIQLDNQYEIKALDEGEMYKYLGFEERAGVVEDVVKTKLTKEYYRRLRAILNSELTTKNKFTAISALAQPVLTYSFEILNWKIEEMQKVDRKTRKILTANKLLHPRADIDRLQLPRIQGGRGLHSLEDKLKTAIVGIAKYIQIKKDDRLIQTVKNEDVSKPQIDSLTKKAERIMNKAELGTPITETTNKKETEQVKELKNKLKRKLNKQRHEKWTNKPLHGQYVREISKATIDTELTFAWLKKGDVKGETEALITAAQDQALATNYHKKRIMKMNINPACRLCKVSDETVQHLVSGCSILAKKDYLERHNQVCSNLHYNICKKYNIEVANEWYHHTPQTVLDNEEATIIWDMQINTDRPISANKPDIVIKDKRKKNCYLIDVSIPSDFNVNSKEVEKLLKYKDLQIEIQRMWNCKTQVIPIVIGATGTISKNCRAYLNDIPGNDRKEIIYQLQKSALFGTAHILRKVL